MDWQKKSFAGQRSTARLAGARNLSNGSAKCLVIIRSDLIKYQPSCSFGLGAARGLEAQLLPSIKRLAGKAA